MWSASPSGRAGHILLLLSVVLAALWPALGPTAPVGAQGGACSDPDGVTVVVDFQSLGAGTIVACAPGPVSSGFDALGQAGIGYQTVTAFPGFICRIQGLPGDADCADTPPANAYWSYWTAERGGSWRYSQTGAGSRTPPAGSVEGWSFSTNPTSADSTPPRTAPPAPVAEPTPTPEPTTAETAAPPQPPAGRPGSGSEGSGGQDTGDTGTNGTAGSGDASGADDQGTATPRPTSTADDDATPVAQAPTSRPSATPAASRTPQPSEDPSDDPSVDPAAAPAPTPTATRTDDVDPFATAEPSATETPTTTPGNASIGVDPDDDGPPTGLLVGGGLATALASAALVVVRRREDR